MELVMVSCKHRLQHNMQGAVEYARHMRRSHGIDINILRPSFTQDSHCKSFKHLEKLKPLPTPLTYPTFAAWTEDTFLEFREHGHVDNVSKIENMNTNPAYGRIVWRLLQSVMSNAQVHNVTFSTI